MYVPQDRSTRMCHNTARHGTLKKSGSNIARCSSKTSENIPPKIMISWYKVSEKIFAYIYIYIYTLHPQILIYAAGFYKQGSRILGKSPGYILYLQYYYHNHFSIISYKTASMKRLPIYNFQKFSCLRYNNARHWTLRKSARDIAWCGSSTWKNMSFKIMRKW